MQIISPYNEYNLRMSIVKGVVSLIASLLILAASSCSKKHQEAEGEGDILVTVGDSSLYVNDVEILIPYGLTPEDSAEMFDRIVEDWIETRVLEGVAKENIVDIERINRLTANYRNRLIVEEYLRKMGDNAPSDVNGSVAEEYYRQNGDSMILKQPLLKGIYIHTSEKDPELDNIRKWISSGSAEDIDKLEKRGLREATGYEYFTDRWVEWDALSRQIPVRVENADTFLMNHPDFETVRGGSVYILHVTDFVGSGKVMPKEFALRKISEMLSDRKKGEYMAGLKRQIYIKALREGTLKRGKYDLFKNL